MITSFRAHTFAGMAAGLLLAAGCPSKEPEHPASEQHVVAPAVRAPAEQIEAKPAAPTGVKMDIAQITKEDCEAIRVALEQRIEHSTIEERAIWLNTIRSTEVTRDVEGTWTIGDWFLVTDDDGLMLSRSAGRTAVGHVVAVTKQNGTWGVGEIVPKFSHPRR